MKNKSYVTYVMKSFVMMKMKKINLNYIKKLYLMKHHYHPKNLFYSELDLEDISDKNYLHVQKVWDVFQIKNLGEYHDL